jgi:hypothetical protein
MALVTKKGVVSLPTSANSAFNVVAATETWKALILWSTLQTATGNAATANATFGFATSSTQRVTVAGVSDDALATSNTGKSARSTAAFVGLSNGTPTVDSLADFVQFNADGFRLNVSDPAAAGLTGGVHYLLLGGADITNAKAGEHLIVRNTAGTEATTGVGFVPDIVFFLSASFTANPTGTDDQVSIGYAINSPREQGAIYWFDNDGTTRMELARYQFSNHCLALANSTPVTSGTATISSFDSDGFTLDWDDPVPTASTYRFYYLALKGGNWKSGVGTEPTTNTTSNHTVGFQTKGTVFFGTEATTDEQTDVNGDRMFHFGASDRGSQGTPSQGGIANVNKDDSATAANSIAKRRHSTTDAVTMVKTSGTSPAVCGDGNLSATSASDFTLTWTNTDATQRQFFWVAAGDTPPPPTATPPRLLVNYQEAVQRAGRW